MAAFAQVTQPSPHALARADAPALMPFPPDPASTRSLAELVAGEIIPRLLMAHEPPARSEHAPRHGDVPRLDVDAFAPLTLSDDPGAAGAHVARLLAQGATVDALMVDLLAPAARLLGTWWEEDRCDFVEVTMGLWRLQEVVHDLSRRVPSGSHGRARRALFAAFPGDQHDFGAVMVSEHFRRHGWDADLIVAADMAALLAAVGRSAYALVGLTVSCDCHGPRLPSAILALRAVSLNPGIRVLIGGRVPNEDPALADRVGADGTARDARGALDLAEALLARTAPCSACA